MAAFLSSFAFIKNTNMKARKVTIVISKGFILLSALSFLSVSIMAFDNPQSVMDLVSVKLTSNDAFSSIRGVYGGVGLALFIVLVYKLRNNFLEGLALLTLLWGLYAVSRVITIANEGALGAFGKQWLTIECTFFIVALTLYLYHKKARAMEMR